MPTPDAIRQLNDQHAIADALRFEEGPGGLTRAVIGTDRCVASLYPHGAHVAGFTPAGHAPVLFMCSRSIFEKGKAIRGGVPVCFPWFGPHPTDKALPSHGPARITEWQLIETSGDGGEVTLELATTTGPFRISHRATFGFELSMTLTVLNQTKADASFEAALHTYLAVSDVREVGITGLEHTDYLDKVDAGQRKNQGDKPITFIGETDRVYINTTSTCVLNDPGSGRRIMVEKSGSNSTVVWNPWVDKAKALADMADDEWPGMVCIETANAGPNAVTLSAGAQHVMNATISVARL